MTGSETSLYGKTTIITYTGKLIDLSDVLPSDIDLVDIAHALSMICRFGGHTSRHYSVASHSAQVATFCPDDLKLEGLLHDSAEAYIGDITRPLKNLLRSVAGNALKEIETKIEQAIALKFGLTYPWPDAIHAADLAALRNEQANFFGRTNQVVTKLNRDLPSEMEPRFISLFHQYNGRKYRQATKAGQS